MNDSQGRTTYSEGRMTYKRRSCTKPRPKARHASEHPFAPGTIERTGRPARELVFTLSDAAMAVALVAACAFLAGWLL